jgi:hypothetical protein
MSETFDMPMWICPACKKEQQEDEYWTLSEGSSITCKGCEKEFDIISIESTMTIEIEAGEEEHGDQPGK